jgi:hypothetical protein
MNYTKPEWLTKAELKAMQLRTAAETERGKLVGIGEEVNEVTANLNALQRRRQELVDGHAVADQKAQAIATVDAEISVLQNHLNGARAQQAAMHAAPAPLMALSSAAQQVVRSLQDHGKLPTLQSTDSPIARAVQAHPAADHTPPAKSLKALRADIAETRAKAIAVKSALRPMEELEAGVRAMLEEMASAKDQVVTIISNIFAQGFPISDLVSHPTQQVPKFALGMALSAVGIDNLVEAAKKKAASKDSGALRMSLDDQEEQLEALQRQLYEMELQEESILNGAERRPGCNPAAVLNIPVEVAAASGFLKIKGYSK